MGVDTKIQWCHHTANTWWGCTKVSEGCKNCYAETFSKRTGHDVWGPKSSRRMMKGVWNEVRKWAIAATAADERRRVFWGSMMDVCEDRPDLIEPRKRFCGLVEELEDLDFLILTKRPENYLTLMPWGAGQWPKNAWAGTSTENQERTKERCDHLLRVNAKIRWLSAEPLLGPIDFTVKCPPEFQPILRSDRINWVIVGGESGGGSRPCNIEWVRSIVRQCKAAGAACFVKQLGANVETRCPNLSDKWPADTNISTPVADTRIVRLKDSKGGDMSEWPEDIRIREFPKVQP